jgi:nucleotide-binding universal stress UspA family protein
MKNILILTDFSESSWNSVEYILNLFKGKECVFYLLNTPHSKNVSKNKSITDIKDPSKQFEILINKIKEKSLAGKHTFIPIFEDCNIVSATRTLVKEKSIGLIVIGTKGLSAKKDKSIGSVSEDIITKVKCSILAIPCKAKYSGIKEIAFPTDYTNFYEAKLLQNVTNILNFRQSIIRFVYLAKNSTPLDKEQVWNKETLQDYFKNKSHSFHAEINERLELAIEKFVAKQNIDLIVMAAKNLNLFEQILFRPHTNEIKYYSKTPFLILHHAF